MFFLCHWLIFLRLKLMFLWRTWWYFNNFVQLKSKAIISCRLIFFQAVRMIFKMNFYRDICRTQSLKDYSNCLGRISTDCLSGGGVNWRGGLDYFKIKYHHASSSFIELYYSRRLSELSVHADKYNKTT